MGIFDKILTEAERASLEEDLPDALMEKIRMICSKQDSSIDTDLLEELLEMLEDYEPFADVGCGNESYSTKDIERAVGKIIND